MLFTLAGGSDFISLSGNITFAPREKESVIQISIVNDDVLEEEVEFFLVNIHVATSAPGLLLGTSMARVTIKDDDCKIHVQYYLYV